MNSAEPFWIHLYTFNTIFLIELQELTTMLLQCGVILIQIQSNYQFPQKKRPIDLIGQFMVVNFSSNWQCFNFPWLVKQTCSLDVSPMSPYTWQHYTSKYNSAYIQQHMTRLMQYSTLYYLHLFNVHC